MIAQAAGITNALWTAGLPSSVIHAWFDTPRAELHGMTPHDALRLIGPPAGRLVLDLARRDAQEVMQ